MQLELNETGNDLDPLVAPWAKSFTLVELTIQQSWREGLEQSIFGHNICESLKDKNIWCLT